jgi:hypothetical protein
LSTKPSQSSSKKLRAAKLNVHAFGMNLHAATTVVGDRWDPRDSVREGGS